MSAQSITVRFIIGKFASNEEKHLGLQTSKAAQSLLKSVDVFQTADSRSGKPHIFVSAAQPTAGFIHPANGAELGNDFVESGHTLRFLRGEIFHAKKIISDGGNHNPKTGGAK